MMHERSSFPGLTAPAAWAASICGSESPIAPRAPTWRKSRRVTPLQDTGRLAAAIAACREAATTGC